MQLDLAWQFIRLMNCLGAVKSYKDCKKQFNELYYLPELARKKQLAMEKVVLTKSLGKQANTRQVG